MATKQMAEDPKLRKSSKKEKDRQKELHNKQIEDLNRSNEVLAKAIAAKKKRDRNKKIATATAGILLAGVAFAVPAIIYANKMGEYTITIQSNAEGFVSYTLKVKKGALIKDIKKDIKGLEGYNFVGIYKDKECTHPFNDNEKLTANSTVYLKFEVQHFKLIMPEGPGFKVITTESEDLDNIEYGTPITFLIQLNEGYTNSKITVKANDQVLTPDAQGKYIITFMRENTVVTIEGVDLNKYTLQTKPDQVTVTRDGVQLASGSEIRHGDKLDISYKESEGYDVDEFTVSGATYLDTEDLYVVTDDVTITYTEVELEKATYDKLTFTFVDDHYEVKAVNKNIEGEVIIPSTYNDHINGKYPVTSIGFTAFASCSKLTSVIIPEGVNAIQGYAFEYCKDLTITIPKSLTSMAYSAFQYGGAKEIIYLGSTADWVNNNRGNAFYNVSIGSYDLTTTDGLVETYTFTSDVPDYIFYGVKSLKTVTFSAGVANIGRYAFYLCGLTNITISNTLNSIGYYAFNRCDNLTNVTYTDSTENWINSSKGKVFENSYVNPFNLTTTNGLVESYNFISDVPEYALYYVKSLKTVTFGDGVGNIGQYAFYRCGLTDVTLSDGVTDIGESAFYYCDKLTSISISKNVTSIGDCAFGRCVNLTKIEYNAININYVEDGRFNPFICAGRDSEGLEVIFGEGVIKIPAHLFDGVYIDDFPFNVQGQDTFSAKITSITISSTVTEIGENAFYTLYNFTTKSINSNHGDYWDGTHYFSTYDLIINSKAIYSSLIEEDPRFGFGGNQWGEHRGNFAAANVKVNATIDDGSNEFLNSLEKGEDENGYKVYKREAESVYKYRYSD